MRDENTVHHTQKLFAAFLYGQNIPGCRYLSGQEVEERLRPLSPGIIFVEIVSRPDSILLLCNPVTTQQSIREALCSRLDCKSVVLEAESLPRMVKAAQSALMSIEQLADPPYRLKTDGAEWEWCLVLCSEQLPSSISEERCFGTFSTKVVPVCILDSRALLARKRRKNASGTRITLGSILIRPWERALKNEGIIPDCLTSRTLNQVDKVGRAAREVGAKLVPNRHETP